MIPNRLTTVEELRQALKTKGSYGRVNLVGVSKGSVMLPTHKRSDILLHIMSRFDGEIQVSVDLLEEDKNPHDKFALRVDVSAENHEWVDDIHGVDLGYIPRKGAIRVYREHQMAPLTYNSDHLNKDLRGFKLHGVLDIIKLRGRIVSASLKLTCTEDCHDASI